MRLSLPSRILAVHLVFMVVLGLFGAWLVRRSFDRYAASWSRELEGLPAEELFSPLASELARSLLLRLESGPDEPQQQIRRSVGEALDGVLPTLPSIERLVIVDPSLRIEYASDRAPLGPLSPPARIQQLGAADRPLRRELQLASGETVVEIVAPVADPAGGPPLGFVLAQFDRDTRAATVMSPAVGEETTAQPDTAAMLTPWVSRVAQSLLLEARSQDSNAVETFQRRVSEGLNRLISELPLQALLIVDRDRKIQYVNDPMALDLTFTDGKHVSLFASQVPVRKDITLPNGQPGVAVMLPVYDSTPRGTATSGPTPDGGPSVEARRLGSVLIQYQPDPELAQRVPALEPPTVGARQYLEPLLLFFGVAVVGGVILAALTGVPVRRLERALDDFRRRGFKGDIDHAGLPADLASTARAISELGGRLAALDARGHEREALLDTLSQSLEDGMLALGGDGQPIAWNPAARRMLLGSSEESDVSDDVLIETLDRNPDLRFAAEHDPPGSTREVDLVLPDGRRALARVTRVPVELGPGVSGVLLLLRDLDALRRVEAHLLDAGRFAVLAHLAAGLAHEIRNPLQAIQLNASVVEQYAADGRAGSGSRAIGESLSTIKDEAQRLTGLLNNYLGLVRPGGEMEPIDLGDLARRVVQLVRYAAVSSRVDIVVEPEPDLPMVVGHAGRLQQAILNLALNAIQAMPDGGRVTLRTSSSGDTVRLTVSDTGPGLAPELADRLFDTRVTTKTEGSGLGLPLVKLVAEAHGGGVWYHSAPDSGASFTIVLPARRGGRHRDEEAAAR